MSNVAIRQRLLTSTIIAGTMALAMPAAAQTTPETNAAPTAPVTGQSVPTAAAASSADGSEGDVIVVTGSRIPRPELASASPVTVVGAAEVKQSGTTRVEDLLNALPQVYAGQGGSISNGSTGTATVDLRNLGPTRTLVLVNGRRLVPGDPRSPVADINIIPASLIKRVDVLTGGASSVYGADAVSGVVNFVMDSEFDGFRLDGQYSLYNHNNRAGSDIRTALGARGFPRPEGNATDGGAVDLTATIGAGFDDGRGHITAYAGYRKIRAVTQDARDYSACALTARTAAAVAATPANGLYTCGGSLTSAPGTFYTNGAYYSVQGNQFVPGTVPFNFAPTNYFQRPDERYTAGFFARYDADDAFKPYLEFMFMDDRTVAQIAPSGAFFGNTSVINCDNPLLSAQQRGIICGTQTTGNATLYVGRRNVEGGGRRDDLQHTTYRGVIGAKGDFAKGFSYDAFYQYGRVNFAQTYRNDFSTSRTVRAFDVVNVNGVPTCRSVVDGTDPACVPYNVFTTGGVTQAALTYLQIPLFSRGQNTEQVVNGSVTFLGGEYGVTSPLADEGFALNFGAEYRKETLNFEVDTNFLSGDGAGQGGPTTPTAGKLDVKEGFVEAQLPLIQDKPFFQDLRVGAGYRYSKYNVEGNGVSNSFKTDTYKFDATWAPVRDFKVRGSYNRAVRAPNVVELFAAQSVGLDGSTDPCSGPVVGGLVQGNTFAQCALTGVTAAQFGNIGGNPANQYNGLTGGNPNLSPEVADSITAGVVLTPTFLPGFQATVDYFDIKLKNQIGVLGADTILQQCIQTGDPVYCALIRRAPGSGSLFRGNNGFVVDTNLNAGELRTKGIDVSVAYTQQLGDLGTLGFTINGTYLDSLIVDQVGDPKFNCKGFFGNQCGTPSPEWRHKARLTYTIAQGASISGAWRYFSKVKSDALSTDTDLAAPNGVGARPGNARIGAQSYFDLALTVPVADKFTFRLGANNLLDKSPPINALGLGVVQNGNTFPQVYDALGRYLYASFTIEL